MLEAFKFGLRQNLASCLSEKKIFSDFSRISDQAKMEYFEELEIPNSQRQEVLDSSDQNTALMAVVHGSFVYQALTSHGALRDFLFSNEIFIDELFVKEFDTLLTKLHTALQKEKLFRESKEPKYFEEMEAAIGEAKVILENIAPRIRKKFFDFLQ